MRRWLLGLPFSIALLGSSAHAQCQDGGVADAGGCVRVFTVSLGSLPQITGAPMLDIDAVVQDDGSIVPRPGVAAGGRVYVTVQGTGAGGGGTVVLLDGGLGTQDLPLTVDLSAGNWTVDGGVFTSLWDGGTSLFLGDNLVTVTAVQPSGNQVTSAPRMVTLDLSFDAGMPDGGLDAGTVPDAGSGTDAGTGTVTDAGTGADAGRSPDAGSSSDAGQSGGSPGTGDMQGCSTAGSGPPSFLLLALAAMLVGLSRRAMRR